MATQDDRREIEICGFLGLRQGMKRGGTDAHYDFNSGTGPASVPIEVKSTTAGMVSTARDVGMEHIRKWRSHVWVFGFYDSKGLALERLLCLKPSQMEPWIAKVESYIKPDFAIGRLAAARLALEDLHIVCGSKAAYSLDDAKLLHKRQWTSKQYAEAMDREKGFSPARMLEILRLRAEYLNERGSTLNNPHIPSAFFAPYKDQMLAVLDGNPGKIVKAAHKIIEEGWRELAER